MTREEAVELVNVYIQALKSGDYSSVKFSSSVSFLGPLHDEPLKGKEAVVTFLSEVSGGMEDVRMNKYVIDGSDVCILIDFETKDGTVLPVVDYIKIEAGQIVHIRPFFDPRPLLGG